ncbi:hypothetical protein WJX81_006706 [Elliptochloris bilobata]|uniref:Ketoreductase domain-containing protein n=1 Tax=Elliptochloris bilobata TaxID=381761 RepID=A0AAW1R0Z9_9CHLO
MTVITSSLGSAATADFCTDAAAQLLAGRYIVPLALGSVAVLGLWRVVHFIRADADLGLLATHRLPRDAFKEKTVWVTGASQGLGEELALVFAAHGARLILTARNTERLQAVQARCRDVAQDARIEVQTLDLTAPYAELQAAAALADGAFGGIDYLVHNAGASQHAAVEETAPEVADRLLELNAAGPIHLTRACLPFMISRGRGRIVAVSSMAAVVPAAGQALYSASKAALNAYLATLQTELCARGIGVTIACPGPVATGSEAAPRNVFSSTGLVKKHEQRGGSGKRLAPRRVAELIARAAYHRIDVCWIARNPVLLIGYLVQYWPALGLWILKKVGPMRAAQLKGGGSGYDLKAMLFGGGMAAKVE